MAIRGYCRTNLDDFKQYQWPTAFVAVPRIGERVQGTGQTSTMGPSLRVVGVTHCLDDQGPYISVKLHK